MVDAKAGGALPPPPGALGLAPMVRCGSLPLRMLALAHGAAFVYTDELVAVKLRRCLRRVAARWLPAAAVGPVPPGAPRRRVAGVEFCEVPVDEFVLDRAQPRPELQMPQAAAAAARTVLQLGAHSPEDAVAAADVVGRGALGAVDLNMGCPRPFSTHAGMGAALMHPQPRAACAIVAALAGWAAGAVPVSAKTRLLPSPEDCAAMWLALQDAGASFLGVHARLVSDRPAAPARWDLCAEALRIARPRLSVPVVLSGDIFSREDAARALAVTGATAAMFARGALFDPTVFAPPPRRPLRDALAEYCIVAQELGIHYKNTKYTVQRALGEHALISSPCGRGVTGATSHERLRASLDLLEATAAPAVRPAAADHVDSPDDED